MENQINAIPVDKTPEQIASEMKKTRESLTEKVAALENQVVGTVQNAANTLTDTVDAVKSFVHDAPTTVEDTVERVAGEVSDRVKRAFDISGHVRSNPWSSVGASVGLGFLAGLLIFREQRSSAASAASVPAPTPLMPPPYSADSSSRVPGLFDDLIGMLGRKMKEVTESVLDATTGAVNKNIKEGIPKLVDEAAKRLAPENEESGERSFDGVNRIFGR